MTTVPTPAPTSASQAADDMRRCCAECRDAAGRDPTGADISGKACSAYPAEWNGGPGVDDRCRALLDAARMTVGACQK